MLRVIKIYVKNGSKTHTHTSGLSVSTSCNRLSHLLWFETLIHTPTYNSHWLLTSVPTVINNTLKCVSAPSIIPGRGGQTEDPHYRKSQGKGQGKWFLIRKLRQRQPIIARPGHEDAAETSQIDPTFGCNVEKRQIKPTNLRRCCAWRRGWRLAGLMNERKGAAGGGGGCGVGGG